MFSLRGETRAIATTGVKKKKKKKATVPMIKDPEQKKGEAVLRHPVGRDLDAGCTSRTSR